MTKPFFSIIIPVYNRQETIGRAITSCLTQTFIDFEIIIINDKSTDETEQVVQSYTDPRIRYFCNEVNSERCVSRNRGIKESKGTFVCFLDSDDYFLENHLSTFHIKIKDSEIQSAFLFSNNFNENEEGDREKKIVPSMNDYNIFQYLLKYTPNPARVCISRDILTQLDFDVRLPGLEDLDLWLRIAAKYDVIQLTDYTSVYYIHADSYSGGDKQRFEKELRYHPIIEKQPELKGRLPKKSMNRLKSMCHFHLAKTAIKASNRGSFYKHAFKSWRLFPKGYNGNTNKLLWVNAIYFIPLIGNIAKWIKQRK